ncbi:MAG: aminopeptidase [Bacteroidales bacterium]|nr:aminopeptidase [Bacteroidales bacterium]
MKRFSSIILLALVSIFCANGLYAQSLEDQFAKLPSVKKVEVLDAGAFKAKYLLWFEQPVSYKDPSKGTFLQRVFVGNVSTDSSTVFVTEGYGAAYAQRPQYREEVSRIFNLNNVVVEHRYFAPSAPENLDWTYLTAENEARDLHRIITELKTIYGGKWISTGISKGGQNCVIYRAFFPKDVDITVSYVGPFCRGTEDGRHEPFIANYCGSESDRARVRGFQREFLRRRQTIAPLLDSLCKANGYSFRIPMNEVFDMSVLEFSFAFWQWGYPVDRIPGPEASDREMLEFLNLVSGPDYWQVENPHAPFFVMAAKELGYYGYDVEPFKDLLTIDSAKGYLHRIFLPEEAQNVKFNRRLSRKMDRFLRRNKCNIVFIYGQYDPWSAVRAGDRHSSTNHIFIDPAGSHRARIGTFDEETQAEIKEIIAGWLYE